VQPAAGGNITAGAARSAGRGAGLRGGRHRTGAAAAGGCTEGGGRRCSQGHGQRGAWAGDQATLRVAGVCIDAD
ncbi:unnamed protein product, partial [Closterium sp. NIES-54]